MLVLWTGIFYLQLVILVCAMIFWKVRKSVSLSKQTLSLSHSPQVRYCPLWAHFFTKRKSNIGERFFVFIEASSAEIYNDLTCIVPRFNFCTLWSLNGLCFHGNVTQACLMRKLLIFWCYLWRLWYSRDSVCMKQTDFMHLPRHLYLNRKYTFWLFMLLFYCYKTFHSLFLVYSVNGENKRVLCREDFEVEQKRHTGNSAKHMATTTSSTQKCILLPVLTKPIYLSNSLLRGLNQHKRTIFLFK